MLIMDRLPDELLLCVFLHLHVQDLICIMDVCQKWRRVGTDKVIWQDEWCSIPEGHVLLAKLSHESMPPLNIMYEDDHQKEWETLLPHCSELMDQDPETQLELGYVIHQFNPQLLTCLILSPTVTLFSPHTPWNPWILGESAVFPHLKRLNIGTPKDIHHENHVNQVLFFIRVAAQAPLLETWEFLDFPPVGGAAVLLCHQKIQEKPWWPASFEHLKRLHLPTMLSLSYLPPCPKLRQFLSRYENAQDFKRLPLTVTHITLDKCSPDAVEVILTRFPRLVSCILSDVILGTGKRMFPVPLSRDLICLELPKMWSEFDWSLVLTHGTIRHFSVHDPYAPEKKWPKECVEHVENYAQRHGLTCYFVTDPPVFGFQ